MMNARAIQTAIRNSQRCLASMVVVLGMLAMGTTAVVAQDQSADTGMMIEQLGLVPTNDGPATANSGSLMIEELGLVPTADGPTLASVSEGANLMIEQHGLVPTSDGSAIAATGDDSGLMIEQHGLVPTNGGPALAADDDGYAEGPGLTAR